MNTLVNFLVGLIILILVGVGIFFGKMYLDSKNEEQTTSIKKDKDVESDEKIKKVNDSINQRDDRIKMLKEVGKKLGG